MAVGRYQHAHAASTYSYTLALSRSPSPSSLPYSFLQPPYPLVLSPPHVPFLPSSHVSPFFSLRNLRLRSLYCLLSLSLSHPLSSSSFFSLFLKHYLPSFLFSHFSISTSVSLIIENPSFLLTSFLTSWFSLGVLHSLSL